MLYDIANLDHQDTWQLEKWSNDQIYSTVKQLYQKVNQYFVICMSNHYSSGKYIDAKAKWNEVERQIKKIQDYCYKNVPYYFYDDMFGPDNLAWKEAQETTLRK